MRALNQTSFSFRVRLVRGLFLLLAAIALGRAIQLQVVEQESLEKRAARQYEQRQSIQLQRGPIVDRNGVPLAVSLPMQSLYAVPQEVENPLEIADLLSGVLHLEQNNLAAQLAGKASFIWLKRHIKPSESKALLDLNLKGVYALKEYERFYPQLNLASHVVGFAGTDSRGLEGLEYQFNSHLMNPKLSNDTWNPVELSPKVDSFSGGGLQLTLDLKLQHFVQRQLSQAVKSMEAKFGVAIVMESQTGEILALAGTPNYDPNNFSDYHEAIYFNRAVAQAYEPGSTFKIVTMAAALQAGVITKDNYFFCENGAFAVGDRVIHDVAPYGFLNLEKIIQKSSNICMAKIAQLIPRDQFYNIIKDFGFGKKTGVELPGEVRGTLHKPKNWNEVSVATLAYGHGISGSAMQVLAAGNVFATGGYWLRPRIIKAQTRADGEQVELPQPSPQQVIRPEVAEAVAGFMATVTQPGGTGIKAHLPGIEIAGKTGTSRKFDAKLKEYSKTKHISSFIGFFPAQAPKFTIFVMVDEPTKPYLDSKSAAVIVREIVRQAKRHYPLLGKEYAPPLERANPFLPPERPLPQGLGEVQTLQRMQGKSLRRVLRLAAQAGLSLQARGSGRVRRVERQGKTFLAILD